MMRRGFSVVGFPPFCLVLCFRFVGAGDVQSHLGGYLMQRYYFIIITVGNENFFYCH